MRTFLSLTSILGLSAGLSGCWLAVVGGAGAEAGYTAGQKERTAGETIDDQLLHTKVKSALLAASEVSSGKIDVTVRRGVVTLKGVLSSEAEKVKAISAAKDVSGVKQVVEKLFIAK